MIKITKLTQRKNPINAKRQNTGNFAKSVKLDGTNLKKSFSIIHVLLHVGEICFELPQYLRYFMLFIATKLNPLFSASKVYRTYLIVISYHFPYLSCDHFIYLSFGAK